MKRETSRAMWGVRVWNGADTATVKFLYTGSRLWSRFLLPLTPALSLRERVSRKNSRFEPPNRRRVFSLSSSGGEGRGEEALFRTLRARFLGRGNPFQRFDRSNPARFADGLAAILPLPKGEGWGEGKDKVRQPAGRNVTKLRCYV